MLNMREHLMMVSGVKLAEKAGNYCFSYTLVPESLLPVRYLRSIRMTKNNLIDHVTETTKGSKKETELVIDVLLATIIEALAKGEKVDLRGFGSFQVSGKKERQGRNPRTGETVTIAARNVAVFKPSKELSGRLNGASEDRAEAGGVNTDTLAQPQQGSEKVHGDKIDV
jgi:nucleoid DNA-binding protein